MSGLEYYGMDGQPITMEEWIALTGSDEKILARTDLPGGVWVSTVLLGMDHSFGFGGPPIIFETMVFESQENFHDLDMDRYSTREQALAGHEAMVTKWTGWTPGDPEPNETETEGEAP